MILDSKKKQGCKNLNTLVKLSQSTDESLWESYKLSLQRKYDQIRLSRLIFPIYSGAQERGLRVSEQEARFAFVESIQKSNLLYSIETPTIKGYQLSGSKPLSAQTDLTVYDTNGNIFCNVEFKSKGLIPKKKGASSKPKTHFKIYKDLQKLLRESTLGLWFHILESVNNSTIPNFFHVISEEIKCVYMNFEKEMVEKPLIFHICVLRHGFSLHKAVNLNNFLSSNDLQKQMSVSLRVSRSKLLDVETLNNWKIHKIV